MHDCCMVSASYGKPNWNHCLAPCRQLLRNVLAIRCCEGHHCRSMLSSLSDMLSTCRLDDGRVAVPVQPERPGSRGSQPHSGRDLQRRRQQLRALRRHQVHTSAGRRHCCLRQIASAHLKAYASGRHQCPSPLMELNCCACTDNTDPVALPAHLRAAASALLVRPRGPGVSSPSTRSAAGRAASAAAWCSPARMRSGPTRRACPPPASPAAGEWRMGLGHARDRSSL